MAEIPDQKCGNFLRGQEVTKGRAFTPPGAQGGSFGPPHVPSPGNPQNFDPHFEDIISKQADRFVPSHEAIVESMVSYEPNDSSYTEPDNKLLNSKRTLTKGDGSAGSVNTPKQPKISQPTGKDGKEACLPNKDGHGKEAQDSGRRLMALLGGLCFAIGTLLLAMYFGPLRSGTMRVLQDFSLEKPASPPISKPKIIPEEIVVTEPQSFKAPKAIALPGVKVYVVGEVKNPGVVSLPFDSRVDDAVKAAGGMTENADPFSVNLAQRIKDEDKIVIGAKGASGSSQRDQFESPSTYYPPSSEASHTQNNDNSVEQSQKTSPTKKRATNSNQTLPPPITGINLNTATSGDLETIEGIGPSLSKAIVDYRDSLPEGRYTSVEQLKDVPGIGDAKLKTIKANVGI